MTQRKSGWIGLLVAASMLASDAARAESRGPTSSITQWGITWTFTEAREHGTYANGDFWVLGPVAITRIEPDFDGTRHGWEVNPQFAGPQALDTRPGSYEAARMPALPYVAQPGQSILKVIGNPAGGGPTALTEIIRTAAVLTVVDAIPAGGGSGLFRPPYVGTSKEAYEVASLHTELLPCLEPVNMPTLDWVKTAFERVQLDHKGGALGRYLHPVENIPDYGADIGRRNADGALRLMHSDAVSAKMAALIGYVQYGIDLYHMMLLGHTWPDGGGHRPGQKLPLTFAAVMLDDAGMKQAIADAAIFHEDELFYRSPRDGRVLYGSDEGYAFSLLERRYWEVVVTFVAGSPSGYKSYRDPYGYIDGGYNPGDGYQYCCTSQPWKGSAIALRLLPQLKPVWRSTEILEYADRWVNFGAWAQPDPCAPPEATMANFGITFGPDGHGGCIADPNPGDGIGRFPARHGQEKDGGGRYSRYQAAMWDAYRAVTPNSFYPLSPCRVLDTRVGSGAGAAAPIFAAHQQRVFTVTGTCGIPGSAQAMTANITVVGAQAQGDLRVTGGHLATTITSALSIPLSRARANNAIIQLAIDGSGTIAVTNDSSGAVHFILDVNGYFR
jgi:hypothetical protein